MPASSRRRGDARAAAPATVRCAASVPDATTAEGVSGSLPAGDQRVRDRVEPADAHQEDERAAEAGEHVPVELGRLLARLARAP